jgi:hypothetical protein
MFFDVMMIGSAVLALSVRFKATEDLGADKSLRIMIGSLTAA